MNSLFENIESAKNDAPLEDVGNQPCTFMLYFTVNEREEFKELVKIGLKETLGEEAVDGNATDFVLNMLRQQYGN